MSLESSIKDVIATNLEDGTVEKLISQEFEKGVKNALDSLFRSYGDVTKVIEEKVKSVMIPYLESYDYSKYLVKLDSVLVEILKSSALDNKKLLENFKELMTVDEKEKEIKVTDLFDKWMDYVAKNVNTDDLEVNHDDRPSYENVEVTFNVEFEEDRDWSSFKYANLLFECEHDEEMNFALRLSRYKKDKSKGWDIRYDSNHDIKSLRYLNEFEILLMKMDQNRTKIILDSNYDSGEVEIEAEPECSCG